MDRDNMLAKAQTLFLDAVAPLSSKVQIQETRGMLLSHFWATPHRKERRKLVVKDLNKDASSKMRAETQKPAVRCLSTNSGGSSQYFRGGHQRGGGRKFQPYQKEPPSYSMNTTNCLYIYKKSCYANTKLSQVLGFRHDQGS